ncbi:MAG TPA: iron ABC transporter permease [Flavobacteriales bacterium]|nr:iron ABC transporter permease [Flavobacteriales bacterium]HRJ34773.1 iron ABC transporter permease [Flavobacteriales bacterium]HRJ38755.1 iron ABC transporter permease [Flavobacteriales bacterium]
MSMIRSLRSSYKGWLLAGIVLLLLIAIPLVILFSSLFTTPQSSKAILEQTLPGEAFFNTLALCVIAAVVSLFLGGGTAWLVTQYQFPLRKFFSWSLALPLTIPGYILAFTYAGIFSFSGPLQTVIRNQFGQDRAQALHFDIMNLPVLGLLFALALFPYVFLSAKAAFSIQSARQIESARSLGKKGSSILMKIALPLSRPALAAGVFLVMMEVINDYGAASYFGIRTYTTALFRTWGYDIQAALLLAGWILLFVFGLLIAERLLRGKARYQNTARQSYVPITPLKGFRAWTATFLCSIPFVFGFLIPFSFLGYWAMQTAPKIMNDHFFVLTWNSIQLAFIATIVIVVVALILAYVRKLHQSFSGKIIAQFINVGYAIPGAVIAVGVLAFSGWSDAMIAHFGSAKGLFFTGSIAMLIFAYLVRFLAVAYQPLEAGLEKNHGSLGESSRSLGKSPLRTLLFVELPLLRNTVLVAAIMVFVDVMKELPLTLILRPFNFETLATETYRHAKIMESVPESSSAALILIFIGAIPVFVLSRLMTEKHGT